MLGADPSVNHKSTHFRLHLASSLFANAIIARPLPPSLQPRTESWGQTLAKWEARASDLPTWRSAADP